MTPAEQYLQQVDRLRQTVAAQTEAIQKVADAFTKPILNGRMVHVFGSGHSRIMVEELWPRYGSFPGFNPIVELSLTHHMQVVGSNGQRQVMFLENVCGLAERILRNFDTAADDAALVISSSGCNIAPIEMAQLFREQGIFVAVLVSKAHSQASESKHPQGYKLTDFADIVLDNGAPVGDAMVNIEGLEAPVSPGSTVGGCTIINCLKAEIAQRLTDAGQAPPVLASGAVVGSEKASTMFEQAYDEHAHRLAKLYANVGMPSNASCD
jgi:uncharacterized phosphosugar-binding protein